MATSLEIWEYPGYPTKNAMRICVYFEVTYAASYKTKFEVYSYGGILVQESWGTTVTLEADSSYGGDDFYKTFTGLDKGTAYYVIASLWNADTNTRLGISEPRLDFETLGGRPSDWYWYSSVYSGATMPSTENEDGSLTVRPLTASEWSAFLTTIEEFREYLEISQTVTYATQYVAANTAYSGQPMTAAQVNGARYMISCLNPPISVPAAVSSGGTITADFINGLKDSLNSIT